jgi:hypothetical protein
MNISNYVVIFIGLVAVVLSKRKTAGWAVRTAFGFISFFTNPGGATISSLSRENKDRIGRSVLLVLGLFLIVGAILSGVL